MSAFSSIAKIPELKRRIIFTLLMLVVYRLGCQVPTPGIDADALMRFFAAQRGTIFGLFDMFSGGALGAPERLRPGDHALHQRRDHHRTPQGGGPGH